MKKLAIMALASLYALTGCERKLVVECIEPLKQYDQLIQLPQLNENEKKHLIELRNQLEYEAKHANTEHFAIAACGSAYSKIQSLQKQYTKE